MLRSGKELSRKHSRNAHAKAESGKLQYDKKVHSTALEPGDRVLVRNLSERGGPGKIRSRWEQDVYTVVKRQSERPVYIVKKENGQGDQKEFCIVTYFCSAIIFLSIQYQHPYPKIRRV